MWKGLAEQWQMSLFRRSVGRKKCQDCPSDSWEHGEVPYKEKQSRGVWWIVHELVLAGGTGIKEVMCEAFPHFSHPRSSRWLRNKNYFTSDHFVQPMFLEVFARHRVHLDVQTVQVSEYQCNFPMMDASETCHSFTASARRGVFRVWNPHCGWIMEGVFSEDSSHCFENHLGPKKLIFQNGF